MRKILKTTLLKNSSDDEYECKVKLLGPNDRIRSKSDGQLAVELLFDTGDDIVGTFRLRADELQEAISPPSPDLEAIAENMSTESSTKASIAAVGSCRSQSSKSSSPLCPRRRYKEQLDEDH